MKRMVFSGIIISCFILLHGLAFADTQCNIIKNSLNNGISLQATVANAISVGVSQDVVSRCAIDAGASYQEVARVFGNVSPMQITSADSSAQQKSPWPIASPFIPPGQGGDKPGPNNPPPGQGGTPPGQQRP